MPGNGGLSAHTGRAGPLRGAGPPNRLASQHKGVNGLLCVPEGQPRLLGPQAEAHHTSRMEVDTQDQRAMGHTCEAMEDTAGWGPRSPQTLRAQRPGLSTLRTPGPGPPQLIPLPGSGYLGVRAWEPGYGPTPLPRPPRHTEALPDPNAAQEPVEGRWICTGGRRAEEVGTGVCVHVTHPHLRSRYSSWTVTESGQGPPGPRSSMEATPLRGWGAALESHGGCSHLLTAWQG